MSTTRPITLLGVVTEDTVGEWKPNASGTYLVIAEGDFGGGTVTMQTSHDATIGNQDVYDNNGILYEIGEDNNYASRILLSSPISVRATLAGATNPSLTIKLA